MQPNQTILKWFFVLILIASATNACAADTTTPATSPSPSPSPVIQSTSVNLARNAKTNVSGLTLENLPVYAVDNNPDTNWNSGADPIQWIEINLGVEATVERIRLIVAQYPDGETTHQLFAGASSQDLELIHTFSGFTSDGEVLEYQPASPMKFSVIKIVTTQSPSWVAWKEIEIWGTPNSTGVAVQPVSNPADTIFFNGTILTMDKNRPTAEAIAIKGSKIVAVGSQTEVMAFRGDQTQVIDLKGLTMLPGFIDSHAHRIGDFGLRNFAPTEEQAIDDAIRLGWTSLHELYVHNLLLARLEELQRAGKLRIRVYAYLAAAHVNDVDMWFLGYQPRQVLGDRLTLAGLKLTLDQEWGETYWLDEEKVTSLVTQADDLGWQFAVHSFTIRSNDLILNAYEKALNGDDNDTHRHRIEHVGILTDAQMQRMARLGIIASVQLSGIPNYPLDQSFQRMIPPEQYPLVARYRDMLDAGVFVIGNTDAPWGTTDWREDGRGDHKGSAMEAIFEAVTRIPYNRRAPETWMLANRITVQEALELMTINGAYAVFQEDVTGSLEVGKYADIVILSANPLTSPVDQIPNISVLMTMIGGKVEYCDPNNHEVCGSTP